VRRRGRTRSSSPLPPTLHSLSLVCSLGLSPRLPFAHSPRASTHLSSLQPCGASRLRTSRTAPPRPGSPPPAASGSPRGHVPCLCLISPGNRVHAAGGRITRRCSRLARACSSALRAGKRAPAAERHPLDVPLKKTTSCIPRPASRDASRACRRFHQRPHRRARHAEFLSSASATPRLGPKSPASLRPGPPRPRPPGSDSAMRQRSSLAFPGARRHRLHSRRCSSAVPEHRGSRSAQHHGSSPPGRATVATSSCEHHHRSRGVSPVSATRWRRSSVHPPI